MAKKTQQKQTTKKNYGSETFFADNDRDQVIDQVADCLEGRLCMTREQVNRKLEELDDNLGIWEAYIGPAIDEIEDAIEPGPTQEDE